MTRGAFEAALGRRVTGYGCTWCGTEDWTALWHADDVQVRVCRACAVETLPALVADAVGGVGIPVDQAGGGVGWGGGGVWGGGGWCGDGGGGAFGGAWYIRARRGGERWVPRPEGVTPA